MDQISGVFLSRRDIWHVCSGFFFPGGGLASDTGATLRALLIIIPTLNKDYYYYCIIGCRVILCTSKADLQNLYTVPSAE